MTRCDAARVAERTAEIARRREVADGILTMETQRGLEDEAVAALEIPVLGGGHVARTIMERRPMVMPDLAPLLKTAAEQIPPEQQVALHRVLDHYGAILAVPMIVGDEVYGDLTMYYPKPREFSAEEPARLVVSDSIVKFHVSSVLRKLGAASRTEAVSLALREKLV